MMFKPQWSAPCLKQNMAVFIALTFLILAFLYTIFFWIYVPQTRLYLPNPAGLRKYLNNGKLKCDLENNISCPWEETVDLKPNTQKTRRFTSPYIFTPKIYNTTSTTRWSNFSRKQKVISCYNCPGWFLNSADSQLNKDFKACPSSECAFGLGDTSKADVLLFFVGNLRSRAMPDRPAGQIWVKCYWESPVHYNYPAPYEPWKSAFNWTFNYRTDSDIFAPVNRLAWRNSADLLSDSVYLEISKNKTRSVAWFVSNCHTQSKREIYVKEMQKYIDVDIYGKCGNKSCKRAEDKECEKKLTSTYKFYLSFENSFCKDYVTEKFFRNIEYRSQIIPVVRGGFDYNKYIPNGIFINSANFSSAKDLSLYLKELGDDHEKYSRMLKEKDKLTTTNYKFDWCDVCEKVHTAKRTKVIPDIKEWSHKDACHDPVDLKKSRGLF